MYIHTSQATGGCEAYRMVIPCDELQRQGYVADYALLTTVQQAARAAQARNVPGPGAYDIYVLPRTAYSGQQALELLRNAGKKLVFEVDDDFTNRYRTVLTPELHEKIWTFIHDYCDAVLVSTEPLAELMRAETNKPVYIAPNCVNWAHWQVKKQKRITIGLTGSPTHFTDWAVLTDVLPKVLAHHADVQLLFMGYTPEYFTSLQQRFPKQVVTYAPRPYAEYPAIAGSVHITLCPIDPSDGFNRSKSGIKAIEGMAAGAAVIATDYVIYNTVLPKGIGYRVPQIAEAWHDAIEDALATRAWEEQGDVGKSHVRRHYSIDQQWHTWWRAFKAIATL